MSSVFSEFRAGLSAFDAPLDARLAFLRRTYVHLTVAVVALAALSAAFLQAGFGVGMAQWLGQGRLNGFLLLGAFVAAGWLARGCARSTNSRALQYLGLAGYVVVWAVMFAPIIAIAHGMDGPILTTAAGLTVLGFGALSAFVLTTKKDFGFLGPVLAIGGIVALATIVLAMIFGWNLGIWFSGAMIVFAIGAILHDTSNVLHQYRTDQHVAASIELFASVAMLFFYVLRLLMQLQRR